MHMDILKLMIFLIFMFSAFPNSENSCPISYCLSNSLPIKFPFRLQGQQTPNCSYTNLTCTTEGEVILDLPGFGDFYVRQIEYGRGYPLILLYDPTNYLAKSLMGSKRSSFNPGVAANSLDYTFYSCPPHLIALLDFPAVGCLSNSSTSVVGTRAVLRRVMRDLYMCKEIATSSVLFAGRDPPDFVGNQSQLVLEWDASVCSSCPFGRTGVSFYVTGMTFIGISGAAVIICIGCCISLIKLFRKELNMKSSNVA